MIIFTLPQIRHCEPAKRAWQSQAYLTIEIVTIFLRKSRNDGVWQKIMRWS